MNRHEEISQVFDPIRRKAKPSGDPRHKELARKVALTDQSCRMLCSLNDYDRMKVTEQILALGKNPNAPDVAKNRFRPMMRLKRQRYPFEGYHYLIRFEVVGDKIVVDDIYFDDQLLKPQLVPGMERNALYRVARKSEARFGERLLDEVPDPVAAIRRAWDTVEPQPVHRVATRHAAVNGMQNDLSKAAWLMGTHVDVAYAADSPQEYTLFHNPSDGFYEDVYECAWDKRAANPLARFGRSSYSANVNHLAAALQEAQQRGHKTQWVAHSQGAIVFARAVDLHRHLHGGSLNMHSVSLHGTGCKVAPARQSCDRAGIKVLAARNNPFDGVPGALGGNSLGPSGLYRAIKFSKLIAGDDPLASPHTLPYLGIRTYHKQLLLTGNHDYARRVQKYMLKHPGEA